MTTIRERIFEILDTSALSEPTDIAEKVIGDLGPRELRAALAEVMPEYVRYVERNHRSSAPAAASPISDDSGASDEAEAHTTRAPGSSRWRILAGRYRGVEERKPLRDCTRDDVLAIVAQHRHQAATNTAAAERFGALHQLMVDRGAATVGELPEAEVEGVLR